LVSDICRPNHIQCVALGRDGQASNGRCKSYEHGPSSGIMYAKRQFWFDTFESVLQVISQVGEAAVESLCSATGTTWPA
jgi:hypothetical protein